MPRSLDKAQAVLALLEEVSEPYTVLPTPRRVTVTGEAVISCAETRVAVIATELIPNLRNSLACDVFETYTLDCTIARECQVEYDDRGQEVDASIASINALATADTDALEALFEALGEDPISTGGAGAMTTRSGTLNVVMTGAMMYCNLRVRID